MTEICFEREDFVHHCTWCRLSFLHMNMNIIEIYACISYIIYLSHTWNDFIWYTNIERGPFSVCTLCGLFADVDWSITRSVHGLTHESHTGKKLATRRHELFEFILKWGWNCISTHSWRVADELMFRNFSKVGNFVLKTNGILLRIFCQGFFKAFFG